jgi:formylglycine-generating enzyme required for sulfatase activity
MFCPQCGKENPDANKFCKNCGNEFPLRTQILGGAVTQTYTMPPDSVAAPTEILPSLPSSVSPIVSSENSLNIESSDLQVTEVIEDISAVMLNPVEKDSEKDNLAALKQAKTVAFSDIWKEEVSGANKIDAPAEKSPTIESKDDLTLVLKESEAAFDNIFPDEKANFGVTEQFTQTLTEKTSFENKFDSPPPIPSESLTIENAEPFVKPDLPLPKIAAETFVREADSKIYTPPAANSGNKIGLIIGAVAVCFVLILGGLAGLGWWFFTQSKSQPMISNSNAESNTKTDADTKTDVTPLPKTTPPGMVYVAGGEFMMGTNDSTDDQKFDTPAHLTTVKPFYIDVTEITNEDYKKFVDATSRKKPPTWKNATFPDGKARFPVTGVDWDDATAYAKWAGKRLPTEEEWEYAARGTDGRRFPWGNDWQNDYANADKQRQETIEVGKSGGKSPFGLADMCGNAWEWTSSGAAAYQNGKEFDAALIEPKIIRGGFFGSSKDKATATVRRAYGARGEKEGYANTGFRCVKDAGND